MEDFFNALQTSGIGIRLSLIAAIVASISFGIVGSFVVVRRISYIAAAIAHSVLGGIGAAIFLQRTHDLDWLTTDMGAIIAALASALIIGWVSMNASEREDTIISAIWASGMAAGILFIQFAPGPAVNLESYILGDILYTNEADLVTAGILGLIVVVMTLLFYPKLVAVCFDEEFARLRGINVPLYFQLLLCLIGLAVVLLVQLTGIILAIALIVLPAATAARFFGRLWVVMLIATGLSMIYCFAGFALAYAPEANPGPVIVLIAALVYGIVSAGRALRAAS